MNKVKAFLKGFLIASGVVGGMILTAFVGSYLGRVTFGPENAAAGILFLIPIAAGILCALED
jgi:hypothetical protein